MFTLPTGTVTFLFTDIEGSTKLWELHPEAMKQVLAKHDAILRQAVETHDGIIVKTTGDGVHAVFGTVLTGIAAALTAQQALHEEAWDEIKPQSLRVRMGLHTGEAEIRAGDYYGSSTNRAARLMAVGNGGQILISNTTAELVREELPVNTILRDLGEHRLKDLSRPEHVYQLVSSSLPSEFPQIQSLGTIPNNLPIQLTNFIGRENETAEITKLLATERLVTLTGSGGTGKTRLAQEVGAQTLSSFPQGVWFIELAPLVNPSQITPALAQIFGLQELPSTPLESLIIDYFREKKALLILDNCEHLIAGCARLVDNLLRHCAQLKIIASSREALGISGEVAYRIPSMVDSEAVQLFLERARAANPKFNLTPNNAKEIARICSRLDGIPLAIELAAARTKLLSPEQIAARLDDRFRLLIGGSRTAIPRQQTLRALIDWSFDMLNGEEKRLLCITSVFSGGWTLEALERVTEDPNTVEHLEQLVNKSLVVTEEQDNTMRYSLLETIRQYAREKLMDAGVDEVVRIRNRHLETFLLLAQSAEPRLTGPEMIQGLNVLEVEQDNLRAALEWAIENNLLAALEMTAVLAYFWSRRALSVEGYTWVKNALDRAETTLPPEEQARLPFQQAKARALADKASLALQLGDNHSAQTAIEASVALARQINATHTLVYALALGCIIMGFQGNLNVARAWSQEAITLSRQHGYRYEQAMAVGSEMFLAITADKPVSPGLAEESIRLARASGNPYLIGLALSNVARVAVASGRWADAYPLLEEAASIYYKMRDKAFYTGSRSEIGHLFRKQGRFQEAEAVYHETVLAFQEIGHRAAVAHELECFAFIAEKQGQNERAAKLLGAADALRNLLGTDMTWMERQEYAQALANLRTQMDEATFAQGWAEGRAMDIDQAIRYALGTN